MNKWIDTKTIESRKVKSPSPPWYFTYVPLNKTCNKVQNKWNIETHQTTKLQYQRSKCCCLLTITTNMKTFIFPYLHNFHKILQSKGDDAKNKKPKWLMQRRLFVASHVPPKTNNQCAPSPKINLKNKCWRWKFYNHRPFCNLLGFAFSMFP